jgi:phosphoserine phosphatase RsbU/P
LTTFSDTTKQDWGWVIAGLLALALFFWLYGDYHPFGVADSSLEEGVASEISTQILQSIGYTSEKPPFTQFRVNSTFLDSIQNQTDFQDFYKSETNRNQYPVFYWQSSFFIEDIPTRRGAFGGNQAKTVRISLNESGEMIAFRNTYDVLPISHIHSDALSYVIGSAPVSAVDVDSTIYQSILFSFEQPDYDGGAVDFSTRQTFGKDIAAKIAEYHLSNSGWSKETFQIKSIEKTPFSSIEVAKVTFESGSENLRQVPELEFKVTATGVLVSLEYSFQDDSEGGFVTSEIVSNVRNAIMLFTFLWILVLLFLRFRMRLIDLKAAILIAVLAGFIYPFITLMEVLFMHSRAFGELNTSLFMSLFLIAGLVAAFASIIFFMVTSIADSITREKWVEKLRTTDLIRTGYFISRPIGLSVVRGVSFGFILVGIWTLMIMFIPNSFISLDDNLFGSSRYLPNIVMILSNFAWFFIITQAIFLIFLGYTRKITKSTLAIVAVTGVIFALINPLAIDIGPLSSELAFLGVLGAVSGLIYLKYDYLTILIALFAGSGLIYTAPGWLLDFSPDSSAFYTHMMIVAGGFIYGSFAIFKGKSIQELPEYVPEYIAELAQEERIKQELQIARKVQESFLPDRTPDFKGLDIAAICKPAHETGGDYYDFIELDDERLAVTIGDVSGKGIQAAFFMTFTKGVLHAICEEFKSSVEVLTKANNLFRRNAKRGTFISLIFGVVDQKNNLFRFSRAGHNPLLYFNSKEEKLHVFKPQGIGLGMADEKVFSQNISELEISFQKNDLLIMFTDGVVEATNNLETFYGDERLHKLIIKNHRLCSEELLEKILNDLEKFVNTSNQHDDMTMLIIKKK